MEAGANAVMLLMNGFTGVTVTGFANNTVLYMEIEKAISQRQVDLDKVALYEQLGFCFGRVRTEYNPTCKKENRTVERIY
jgi:6-phosphofructokinase 1